MIRLGDPGPELVAYRHHKHAEADPRHKHAKQSKPARPGLPNDGRFAFRVLIPGMHRERSFGAELLFASMTMCRIGKPSAERRRK
jgi:hypothetical protein